MYNKVTMLGHLTRDIELKYLPSGTAIAKSSIATSHKYKAQTGEQKEEVCFLEFTIMGRFGEVANQYLRKGSKVLLEGRLSFEQWTAQDGSSRSRHVLKVDDMKMLDSKPQNDNSGYGDHNRNNSGYSQSQNKNDNYANRNNGAGYNSSGNNGAGYNSGQRNQQYAGNNNRPSPENLPEIDLDEEIPF